MFWGGTKGGNAFYINLSGEMFVDARDGIPLITLALPILSAASIATLLVLPRENYASNDNKIRHSKIHTRIKNWFSLFQKGGDIDMNRIAMVFLAFPTTIYLLSIVIRITNETEYTLQHRVRLIGNAFGLAAIVSLSFWLIPISRHSIVLHVLGCNPIDATRLHMWAGRTCMVGTLLHTVCHLFRWAMLLNENVIQMFLPPPSCWSWNHESAADQNGPVCYNEDTACTCNDRFLNLSGLLAFIALAAIIVTSVQWFRRKHYRIFYLAHVTLAPMFLIAAVLHWKRLILVSGVIYCLSNLLLLLRCELMYKT